VAKDFNPRGYQTISIGHLLDTPRCALWASMGAGKTVSTLTALDALYLSGEEKPTLVIAPLRVATTTWPEEVKKWKHLSGLLVSPVVGNEKERLLALKRDVPIYTTNYEQLPWLQEYYGDRWPFATVVSDESTRLKSLRLSYRTAKKKDGTPGKEFLAGQGGKRARALGMVAHTKIKRMIELTGTPAPNGLLDLWGQAWFLDAGQRLGRTFEAFKQRWFQKSYDGYSMKPLPHAQAEIQAALSDLCLTIDAKDWFDLKDPIVNNIYVDLPVKAMKLYRDMEQKMFAEIEGHGVEAFNAATMTMKCLQIANGAAYVDDKQNWKELHDAKIQALDSIIEEASGAPVLVAYHFKPDLARLQKAFPAGRTLDADPKTIREWNKGNIPVLFAHPQSAGHGLNLQDGGNILVFFAHWWSLEEYQQIIERIGPVRQLQAGHDRPVFIHHIVARNTVDEIVMERRATKRDVQDLLLDAMKRRRT
jgi:SNF2 family DNA or RNA helicase